MLRLRPVAALAATAALALALVGCTAETPAPTQSATPKPPAVVEPTGDGVLRIGTITDAAASGGAIVTGVELAARTINTAGGVGDAPVEVFHRAAANPAAVQELVDRGVDVIVIGSTVVIDPVEGVELVTVTPATTPDEALAGQLRQIDPFVTEQVGAPDAIEAVVAVALAAVVAGDDGAASIEANLEAIRQGDAECASFGECLAALGDDFTIAYTPRWS